jgi:acetylcholinesterase
VQYSQELKQDVVFVSFNHRLNAFGGLAGREMQDAGVTNLMLKDQRTAFEWIQRYIHLFGGDPSRVLAMGESSGSMSIALQMVLNGGNLKSKQKPKNKIFNSAWMFSGAAPRFDPATGARQQATFDTMAQRTGCGNAQDKLACLRQVPFDTFYSAVQSFPSFFSYSSVNGEWLRVGVAQQSTDARVSLAVPWYPHPDGTYLTDNPADLAAAGKIANIPFVLGDMRDEGTIFSLVPPLNVTTEDNFKQYIHEAMFPNATVDEINQLATLYPQDPAQGSPYGTGVSNQATIGPQYKRIASILGDITFQSGRRPFLDHAPNQNKWTYITDLSLPLLSSVPLLSNLGLASLPILGSFHVSDAVLYIFGLLPRSISANSRNIMAGLIRFANTHDPSPALAGTPAWPMYDPQGKNMYNFREEGPQIIKDDFRVPQMAYLNSNPNQHFNF